MGADPFQRERLVIEALFYRHRSSRPETELFRDLSAVKHDALLHGDAYELRMDYERLARLASDALEAEHERRRADYAALRLYRVRESRTD